jgi:hypothetical protein
MQAFPLKKAAVVNYKRVYIVHKHKTESKNFFL